MAQQRVADNRETMKRWFKTEIEFWGQEASNLFKRWKEIICRTTRSD